MSIPPGIGRSVVLAVLLATGYGGEAADGPCTVTVGQSPGSQRCLRSGPILLAVTVANPTAAEVSFKAFDEGDLPISFKVFGTSGPSAPQASDAPQLYSGAVTEFTIKPHAQLRRMVNLTAHWRFANAGNAAINWTFRFDAFADDTGKPAIYQRTGVLPLLIEDDEAMAFRAQIGELERQLQVPGDEPLRQDAIAALCGCRNPDIVPHLARLLDLDGGQYECSVIEALCRFPDHPQLPEIRHRILASGSETAVGLILDAELGASRLIGDDELRQLLSSPKDGVRYAALMYVGKVLNRLQLGRIHDLGKDANPNIGNAAEQLLRSFDAPVTAPPVRAAPAPQPVAPPAPAAGRQGS